ncbi:MAG: glycosyltransferase family 4 protein [Desulfobacterales bacterium]|nr:glycosyltransferase family 4 protein [Desulfobacterales bacterium]
MRTGTVEEMVAESITVVQMLPDLEGGGVERGTLELARYLCQQGHRSIVISAGGRMVSQLEKEGSRHITWEVGVKRPACLKTFFPLRRLLQEEHVDILHVRSRLPAWIGYLVWRGLPEKTRPRLVTTFHGFYSVNPYSAVMTKGERVIAISKSVADHIRQQYKVSDDRVVLIYRGVDENYFSPSAVSGERIQTLRERWDLADYSGPIIMLPGRISPWKGHDVFFRSLGIFQKVPWKALCVGDDTESSHHSLRLWQMIQDLGLAKRIQLVGHCDDMPAALMLADVVVSASSSEPEAFGRIAVEAQAMGKPVIASAHGGSLETVLDRKTGWLVPPNDELSLADALTEAILDKDKRSRFGREGRKRVLENFTVEKMCRSTLELYQDLLLQGVPSKR